MGAFVMGQVAAPREVRPTVFADIRFLACVESLVLNQLAAPREARPAILAAIRFLACVGSLVLGQAMCVLESFATPRMVAGALLFQDGSLHRVRRWRWGHWRFSRSCRGCRSYVRQQALLAVGGNCL